MLEYRLQMNNIISQLKKKIGSGELDYVISELILYVKDKDNDLHNQLIVLKSKHTKAKNSRNLGIIDYESFQRIEAQISFVILNDYLEQVNELMSLYQKPRTKPVIEKLSQLQIQIDNVKDELGYQNLEGELINEKTLKLYLKRKYPELPFETNENHFDSVFSGLDLNKYKYIRDIGLIFKLTEDVIQNYKGEHKNCLGLLALAIGCVDLNYRNDIQFWTQDAIQIFEEFSNGYKLQAVCSFCGADKKQVKLLIRGKTGHICESCSQQAYEIKTKEGF